MTWTSVPGPQQQCPFCAWANTVTQRSSKEVGFNRGSPVFVLVVGIGLLFTPLLPAGIVVICLGIMGFFISPNHPLRGICPQCENTWDKGTTRNP